jgi:hypothetical protein
MFYILDGTAHPSNVIVRLLSETEHTTSFALSLLKRIRVCSSKVSFSLLINSKVMIGCL